MQVRWLIIVCLTANEMELVFIDDAAAVTSNLAKQFFLFHLKSEISLMTLWASEFTLIEQRHVDTFDEKTFYNRRATAGM